MEILTKYINKIPVTQFETKWRGFLTYYKAVNVNVDVNLKLFKATTLKLHSKLREFSFLLFICILHSLMDNI